MKSLDKAIKLCDAETKKPFNHMVMYELPWGRGSMEVRGIDKSKILSLFESEKKRVEARGKAKFTQEELNKFYKHLERHFGK